MANPKVGNKAKLKEDKNKLSSSITDIPDASVLRKPIQTSITGLAQARKIFDTATEELKGLLTTECDLLYECKVCRNLFRSLANFISHKRVYCKEKFNSSVHGHFIKPNNTMSEILTIKHVEEGYQDYMKNKSSLEPEVPSDRVPLSKDLTAVVEDLMKNAEATTVAEKKPFEVAVQAIPNSSVAVFQNVVRSEDDDEMCTEVTELDSFMAKDSALLEANGKFEICAKPAEKQIEKEREKDDEQVIQISDDDDNGQLSCKICDIQFSTRKTLKFHMKYKHVPDRLVYPCTDCCDIFATSWSVLRHLYRVHRKTLTQIRRMRELVQSRAFRMNNVPTSYVKKKNIKKAVAEEKLTEEERMDQENQAWMDNMESDSELPRCGGCGRSFERRAALAAHTYTCQSRTRALARKPTTPYERPIVKKEVKTSLLAPKPLVPANTDVSDGEKAPTKEIKPLANESEEKEKTPPKEMKLEEPKEEMEVDEIPSEEESKNNEESDPEGMVLNAQEKANMDALKKKIVGFVHKDGTCKVCQRKYTTPSHLCRHMASHLTWRRFGCKLCNYANYDKNRLVIHAQSVHKLKGSEEFYTSIIRVITPTEALSQSATPNVVDEEWIGAEDEESSEFGEVSASSGDESESSSSRMESSKPNRRKQTFKPIKVSKSKSSESANDDEKSGIKRQSQTPIDKESLCDEKDKNKQNSEQEKKEDEKSDAAVTDSRRPVRKRTRPKKDEDFEYDFSNLMRWESNSYKESEARASSSRNISTKRKSTADNSPSESSPEKPEKQEKNETKLDTLKVAHTEEKKKSYAGALATMSDRAVAQYRAHLRPVTLFTPDRLLLLHKVPFDVREHMKKIQSSKVIVPQQIVNKRKNFTISSSAFDKNEHNKVEGKKELVDIEKEIEDANAANKKNVFQATNVRTLVQVSRPTADMVHNSTLPSKKQKVIVMKRVNLSGDTKSAGGTIQFQRIKYGSSQPINIKQAKIAENPLSTEDRTSNPVDSTNIDNSSDIKEENDKIIEKSCANGSAAIPKDSDQPETIAIM